MKQERTLSALTFNYLRRGTAEHVCLWIPHFHKWINTQAGASLSGASSHLCLLTDFPSDIVFVTTGIKPEENLPERLSSAPSSADKSPVQWNGTKSPQPPCGVFFFPFLFNFWAALYRRNFNSSGVLGVPSLMVCKGYWSLQVYPFKWFPSNARKSTSLSCVAHLQNSGRDNQGYSENGGWFIYFFPEGTRLCVMLLIHYVCMPLKISL